MQPLDVAFFKPLKVYWEKFVNAFCFQSFVLNIQKQQLAPMLKNVLDSMKVIEYLKNGFRKCGLYPFSIKAIDVSKILAKSTCQTAAMSSQEAENVSSSVLSPSEFLRNLIDSEGEMIEKVLSADEVRCYRLKNLEMILGDAKVLDFKSNFGHTWKGLNDDKRLFDNWVLLSNPEKVTDLPEVTSLK